MLELDDIKLDSELLTAALLRIPAVLSHCRFASRLSLSHSAVSRRLFFIPQCPRLSEICLEGLDLRHSWPTVNIPLHVHLVRLKKSRFTARSLCRVFQSLSSPRIHVSLFLQDIGITESEVLSLFDPNDPNPIARVTGIWEFDWSGNPLPRSIFSQFVDFCFHLNGMGMLGLDRVFWGPSGIRDLQDFVTAMHGWRIWGLSIRGSPVSDFGTVFNDFLNVLGKIEGLELLHIDGHSFGDNDVPLLLKLLRTHGHIQELSCNSSAISYRRIFLDFYGSLFTLSLTSLRSPLCDAERLFPNNSFRKDPEFDAFCSALEEH